MRRRKWSLLHIILTCILFRENSVKADSSGWENCKERHYNSWLTPREKYRWTNSEANNLVTTKLSKDITACLGNINTQYETEIKRNKSMTFVFDITSYWNKHEDLTNARFIADVPLESNHNYPLLFSIAQQVQISGFELPNYYGGTPQNPERLGYSVAMDVSPASSQFLKFENPGDVTEVTIKANSDTKSCLTLSVQTPECPIYDDEMNVRFEGIWHTMRTKTAMIVQLKNTFQQGFIVVIVAHSNDECCSQRRTCGSKYNRSSIPQYLPNYGFKKQLNGVNITIIDTGDEFGINTFLATTIPILVNIVILAIVQLGLWHRYKRIIRQKRNYIQAKASSFDAAAVEEIPLQPMENQSDPSQSQPDDENSTWFQRLKADFVISDIMKIDPLKIKSSGRRFLYSIIVVSLFYAIPVGQMIWHYISVLHYTGEYDICYYNYLCAHRLGPVEVFNHFWSNISYLIFGIAFICFVWKKSKFVEELNLPDHGIPQNWGIFYTMGIALFMEGVFSASYHLCPNQSTFQFDTCFMYVISVLLLLKMYQFRHVQHFGAHQVFGILGMFILCGILGLLFEYKYPEMKWIFRLCFALSAQISIGVVFSIYWYSLGYIQKKRKGESEPVHLINWTIFLNLRNQLGNAKLNCGRLILPTMHLLVAILVFAYGHVKDLDFSSYLLYLLIGNVLIYLFYYALIMKLIVHREYNNRKAWIQPSIYIVLSSLIGCFAVINYFSKEPARWDLPAADSREGNEECLWYMFPFFPYYDSHDMWHFISALSLFLSFMSLLVLDDDLLTVSHQNIRMF